MEITTQPTPLSNAVPQGVVAGGAGSAGTGKAASRDDHAHANAATSYGSPGNSAVGDVAADGVATSLPRSDHRHGREAFGAFAAMAFGSAGSNGSAATVSHSDHVHSFPTAQHIEAKITAGGIGESVTWTASFGAAPAVTCTADASSGLNNAGAWNTARSTTGATAFSFNNAVQASCVKSFIAVGTT